MLGVRNIKGFNLAPCLPKLPKYSLSYSQSTDFLASLSIVFAASPSAIHHKMMELCDHTAQVQVSSYHACAEDGNLKCSHLPIFDGDNWEDLCLVAGWIWGRQTSDMQCT